MATIDQQIQAKEIALRHLDELFLEKRRNIIQMEDYKTNVVHMLVISALSESIARTNTDIETLKRLKQSIERDAARKAELARRPFGGRNGSVVVEGKRRSARIAGKK